MILGGRGERRWKSGLAAWFGRRFGGLDWPLYVLAAAPLVAVVQVSLLPTLLFF
jgi:hypothetical protein